MNAAFRSAVKAKFPSAQGSSRGAAPRSGRAPKTEKEILLDKYRALQQDVTTYENNIGFFSASKNSEPLIKQMQERIEQAKAELKELEQKIRETEEVA